MKLLFRYYLYGLMLLSAGNLTVSCSISDNPIGTHSDRLLNGEIFTPALTQEITNYVKQFIY